jgi:transcriptional regulator with XRE-family HTH domain
VLEDVGRNFRKLRRERDLTQGQVARFAGLRQQELSAIERGLQPKSALIDRLARALGVHPNELLRSTSDPRPTPGARHSPPALPERLGRERRAAEHSA